MEFIIVVLSAALIAFSLFMIFGVGVTGLALGLYIFTAVLSVSNILRMATR